MATPQTKLKLPKPRAKSRWSETLPIRVPSQLLGDFFLELDVAMTDKEFEEFVQANSEMRIERSAKGVIEVMPPAKSMTGFKNSKITSQLEYWADNDGSGLVFDSSSGFKLPNGATRAPDASWVKRERLTTLTQDQLDDWLPLCPDFVVELRSSSDRINRLKEKMEEYIANGAQLGWLIDPIERRVYVYRPNTEVEILENPAFAYGEPVLSGFVLKLDKIFDSDF